MSIEVLTGMPGAGKTSELVRRAQDGRGRKETVFLFVPRTLETEHNRALSQFGNVASRAGAVAPVDHFLAPNQTSRILQNFLNSAPATLLFDEAQYYGTEFVALWESLSRAGHTVVISTPSQPQLDALAQVEHTHTRLRISCNLLDDDEATEFFVVPERHMTLAVCAGCASQLQDRARRSVRDRLIANEPHPGEPVIYQPVPLKDPMFDDLRNLRPDSETRAEIMKSVINEHIGTFPYRQASYLDVGCNTGFFCKVMASSGFRPTGVDVVKNDIALAKVLDSWLYRSFIEFVCQDAMDWVMEDTRTFDVVSSFSVFQWLYVQQPGARVDAVLQRFLQKVDRVLFFEMGYGVEAHYTDTPAAVIDRAWVMNLLEASRLFQSVRMIPAGDMGLKRDFFIAIR